MHIQYLKYPQVASESSINHYILAFALVNRMLGWNITTCGVGEETIEIFTGYLLNFQ